MVGYKGSSALERFEYSGVSKVLIECNTCNATVDAKEIGEKGYGPDEQGIPYKYMLLECPVCNSVLLGYSEIEPDSEFSAYLEQLLSDLYKLGLIERIQQ